jgi:hypothetical protein
VLDGIRRVIGLHVHEWEEIAGEEHHGPKPAEFVQPGWRPWDVQPAAEVFDLKTVRCRTCGRVRTWRVRVG